MSEGMLQPPHNPHTCWQKLRPAAACFPRRKKRKRPMPRPEDLSPPQDCVGTSFPSLSSSLHPQKRLPSMETCAHPPGLSNGPSSPFSLPVRCRLETGRWCMVQGAAEPKVRKQVAEVACDLKMSHVREDTGSQALLTSSEVL